MANANRPPAQPGSKPSPTTNTPTHAHPPGPSKEGPEVRAVQPPVRVEVNAPQHQAPAPTMPQRSHVQQPVQVPAAPATTSPDAATPSAPAQTRGLPGDGPTTRPDAGGQDPKAPTPAAQSVGGQPPAGAQVNPGASTPTPTSKG